MIVLFCVTEVLISFSITYLKSHQRSFFVLWYKHSTQLLKAREKDKTSRKQPIKKETVEVS